MGLANSVKQFLTDIYDNLLFIFTYRRTSVVKFEGDCQKYTKEEQLWKNINNLLYIKTPFDY